MEDVKRSLIGRPRSPQVQGAILQATLELLAKVGYNAMSIESIAAHAKVGKSAIYRRYSSKEALVAEAIESVWQDVVIPDTGHIETDIEALIDNAAQATLNDLGRQTVAMIISSAAANSTFSHLYWEKYLLPRQNAFAVVIERAKQRNQVDSDLDPALIFNVMSGIMLYTLIFPPDAESWSSHVRRALAALLRRADRSSAWAD